MTIDLDIFRAAKHLEWKRWTVFAPSRGDDGNLIADGVHSMPLDTYTTDSLTGRRADWAPITTDGVGIVIVDPQTLDDVHDAIRQWCRDQIGRDDITFTA